MAGTENTNAGLDRHTPGTTAAWSPAGWMTNHEAARALGVGVELLTGGTKNWRWRKRLRCGKCVPRPGGGHCNIYPIAEIERLPA